VATPRELSSYPLWYYDFFRKAAHERVSITFASRSKAQRLRNRLYAFRTALLEQADDSPTALIAPLVTIRVEDRVLIGQPKEDVDGEHAPTFD